ncbi:MAG: protein kinase domain-containing protein [Planctomycetota bacterium]
MAKYAAQCPKCGHAIEVDAAVDDFITCPACEASLSVGRRDAAGKLVDPLVGRTFGDFAILERIGRGGMGVVYKARQSRLDRLVALKILPRAHSKTAAARFQREARAAAAIAHPGIVAVLEVGEAEGYRYIAMEFVEGESLRAMMRREGRLAPDRAIDLMSQVTSALVAAHEAGVVHRDIKPSNILIDPSGAAKLVDFGLAKRPKTDVTVTAEGASLGTPLYMPPEMGRGQKALDARADLYSLGATFYHALAGRPPFEAESTVELVVKHATERPQALGAVAPGLDRGLTRIIDKLLRKNPDARYPSAQALLDDLDALGGEQAVDKDAATLELSAERRRAAERAVQRRRRLRSVAAIAGLAAVGVVLIAVLIVAATGSGGGDAARQALSEGLAYEQAHPEGPAGALRRFEAVRNQYPDSDAASRASQRIQALEPELAASAVFRKAEEAGRRARWDEVQGYLDRLRARHRLTRLCTAQASEIERLGSRAAAARMLVRDLRALRDRVAGLTQADRFGDAREAIRRFAAGHAGRTGREQAGTMERELLSRARERYEQLIEESDAALDRGDPARACKPLDHVVGSFGLPEFVEPAKAKLAQIREGGTLFGCVDGLVTHVTDGRGHVCQAWRILPEFATSDAYEVRMQHAAAGDAGAFRIAAWADTTGDKRPDTCIGTSPELEARSAGDWSAWQFRTTHRALFVGNRYRRGTRVYYIRHEEPAGFVGLEPGLYFSRAPGKLPRSHTGSRYANILVRALKAGGPPTPT